MTEEEVKPKKVRAPRRKKVEAVAEPEVKAAPVATAPEPLRHQKLTRRMRRLFRLSNKTYLRRSEGGRFHTRLPIGPGFYPLRKVLRAVGVKTRVIGVASAWDSEGHPTKGMLRAVPQGEGK